MRSKKCKIIEHRLDSNAVVKKQAAMSESARMEMEKYSIEVSEIAEIVRNNEAEAIAWLLFATGFNRSDIKKGINTIKSSKRFNTPKKSGTIRQCP